MKRLYLFLIIIFLIIFTWLTLKPKILEPKAHIPQIEIAGKVLNLELANTEIKRELGLSGHKPLGENDGMLFIFEKPGIYPFWMKDMLFSIDIIWINKDFKINHIEKNVSPEIFPQTFSSKEDALYVLEVRSGFSEKTNLEIGESVKFLP